MGRPATTPLLVREIHATLVSIGYKPGDRMPRQMFQRLVMVGANIGSVAQERNIAQSGEILGYWRRHTAKDGEPAMIEVLRDPLAPDVALAGGVPAASG